MKSRRIASGFAGLLLGAAAALAWATPASAHTQLVSSSPAPGSSVAAPAAVSLTFSEALLDLGSYVRVVDAADADRAVGAAYLASPETLQVDVGPLEPGEYTVTWRAVADDGHPIEGTFAFEVVSAAASSASPSSPGASPSAAPAQTLSAAPTPSPSGQVSVGAPSDPAHLTPLIILILGMVAAAVVIAIAIYFSLPKDSITRSRLRRKGRQSRD